MNRTAPAILATLLAFGTPAAFAASSTDLNVAGSITPNACTPTLGPAGVIDFGKIPAKDLVADVETVPLDGSTTLELLYLYPFFSHTRTCAHG